MSDPPAKALEVIGGDELRPRGCALVCDIVHLENAVRGHVMRPADGERILPHTFALVHHVDDALPPVAPRGLRRCRGVGVSFHRPKLGRHVEVDGIGEVEPVAPIRPLGIKCAVAALGEFALENQLRRVRTALGFLTAFLLPLLGFFPGGGNRRFVFAVASLQPRDESGIERLEPDPAEGDCFNRIMIRALPGCILIRCRNLAVYPSRER